VSKYISIPVGLDRAFSACCLLLSTVGRERHTHYKRQLLKNIYYLFTTPDIDGMVRLLFKKLKIEMDNKERIGGMNLN